MNKTLPIFLIAVFHFSCISEKSNHNINDNVTIDSKSYHGDAEFLEFNVQEFERGSSFDKIQYKINNQEDIVIHLRIPLCDNKHQGIVPVSKKLGNGFDLQNNLYWGAKYGFKNHFRKHTNWTFIQSEKDISNEILERVIFKKKLESNTTVFLIADAYRGDKMKECVSDYLNSVAGRLEEIIELETDEIKISSYADLLIFNGHNGLMDFKLDMIYSKDQKIKECAVIGCVSHQYFKDHLLASKGYPILTTTNLMAPEAYVVEALIESWLQLDKGEKIRKEVAKAYHKYQNCGMRGATKLFKTGW